MEREKPVSAGRRWTPAEGKQLQDMLDGGKTALVLQNSQNAVRLISRK
jgi:hypothetical protein